MNITQWHAANIGPSSHWTRHNSCNVMDVQRDYVKNVWVCICSIVM